MGREIRRVPQDWEHPKHTTKTTLYAKNVGEYIPLHDNDYESAAEEWVNNFMLWQQGKHTSQPCDYCKYFWEYSNPPDEESYRKRKWTAEEATHYQMYETVSEGVPVTLVFATKEELVEYLVAHGDFWDKERGNGGWPREAAEKFVKNEWAPSMIVHKSNSGIEIKTPRDGA